MRTTQERIDTILENLAETAAKYRAGEITGKQYSILTRDGKRGLKTLRAQLREEKRRKP